MLAQTSSRLNRPFFESMNIPIPPYPPKNSDVIAVNIAVITFTFSVLNMLGNDLGISILESISFFVAE